MVSFNYLLAMPFLLHILLDFLIVNVAKVRNCRLISCDRVSWLRTLIPRNPTWSLLLVSGVFDMIVLSQRSHHLVLGVLSSDGSTAVPWIAFDHWVCVSLAWRLSLVSAFRRVCVLVASLIALLVDIFCHNVIYAGSVNLLFGLLLGLFKLLIRRVPVWTAQYRLWCALVVEGMELFLNICYVSAALFIGSWNYRRLVNLRLFSWNCCLIDFFWLGNSLVWESFKLFSWVTWLKLAHYHLTLLGNSCLMNFISWFWSSRPLIHESHQLIISFKCI